MKITVLVKEVPDTYGDRELDLETGLAVRTVSDAVADEVGERALEVALSYADSHAGTEIVVVSMGPPSTAATLRKMLAMGADSVVQIADDRLSGADLGLTAEVLAAAVKRIGFDAVIAGNISTDGSGGVLPAMLGELLGVPHATNLTSVELMPSGVTGTRATDGGIMQVTAALPAVLSVTEAVPDARLPNFKGIMAAKKKPFETLSLDDLAVTPDATASIMTAVSKRPPRSAGVKITDEGDAGERLADFLIQNRLA